MPKKLRLAKTDPTDGQTLVYSATTGLWEPSDGGGGGCGLCAGQTEDDGDILVYDETNDCWLSVNPAAVGIAINPVASGFADLLFWFLPDDLEQWGDGVDVNTWRDISTNESDFDTYDSGTKFDALANATSGWWGLVGTSGTAAEWHQSSPTTGLKSILIFALVERTNWTDESEILKDSSQESVAFFKGTLVSSNEGIGLSVNSTTCHLDVSGWTTLNDSGYVLWIGFAAYQGDSGGPNYTEFASVVTTDDTDALDYARQNTAKTTLPNFKLDKMGDATNEVLGPVVELLAYGSTTNEILSTTGMPRYADVVNVINNYFGKKYPAASLSRTTADALKDDEVVYYASDFGNVVAHMEAPHLYTEGYGVPPAPIGAEWIEYDNTVTDLGPGAMTHESASNFRWSTVATINGYTPLDPAASTPALTNSLDTDTAAFGSSSSGFTFIGLCYLDSDPANGTTNKSLIATATDTTRNVYFVRGASTAFMHVMVSSTAYTVSIDINTYLTASNWHLMVWRRLTGGDWYGYLDATNRSAATKANETNTWSFATMFGGGYASDETKSTHWMAGLIYDEDIGLSNINGICNKLSYKYGLGQTWSLT